MEINDFKPKDPVDTPGTESPTAVKEAVVEEAPVEEEATVEATVEKEPVLTLDGQTISPSELAESLVELKDRAKAAGDSTCSEHGIIVSESGIGYGGWASWFSRREK